jgi:hypothetical protein
MLQQEIQFFWPLTEQIPLDLDCTDCNKPKYYCSGVNSIGAIPGSTSYSLAPIMTGFQIRPTPVSVGLAENVPVSIPAMLNNDVE